MTDLSPTSTPAPTTEASPLGGTPTPAAPPAPSAQETFYPEPKPEAEPVPQTEPEGAPAPEGEPKPEAPPALTPESYSELKIPEGFVVNEESLGEFKTMASELGIPVDKAQSLFDLGMKQVETAVKTAAEQQVAEYNKILDGWKSALATDTEIGGEKAKDAQVFLGRALDEFGTPEARAAFDQTGAGWNPAVVKFVYNMARALVEGGPTTQGGPPSARAKGDITSIFYPNS